ncbi:MAG TPA: TlpA disulfide reductase family protein [Bacillaceae bacterium]
MKKNIFGLAIIVMLAGIVIVNVLQDAKERKEEARAQEEFLAKSAEDEAYEDTYDEGLSEGDIPPDFELETIDGTPVKLSDYKGKKVILNFWATWCPPCKAEMPHMEKFYKDKAKDLKVEIIAVNLTKAERGSNRHEKIKNFIKEYGLTFPIPLDVDGKVGETYQTYTIPTSYIIDSKGLVAKKIIGPMDEEMMEKLVKAVD